MSTGSISRTRFIRASDTTTWRPLASGVAPPTSEVFPPWGTMPRPAAPHICTAADTAAVLSGRTTQKGSPRYSRRQSVA